MTEKGDRQGRRADAGGGDRPRREAAARDRPARRRRKRRQVPIVLAAIVAAIALAAGMVLGYAAKDDPPVAGPVTVEREVRVVTVTVPEAP
jgi:hypothetical protein